MPVSLCQRVKLQGSIHTLPEKKNTLWYSTFAVFLRDEIGNSNVKLATFPILTSNQ